MGAKEDAIQTLENSAEYFAEAIWGRDVRQGLVDVANALKAVVEGYATVVTDDLTDADPNAAAQAAAVKTALENVREEIGTGLLATITNYGVLPNGSNVDELLGTGALGLMRNSFVTLRGDYTYANAPFSDGGYLLSVGLSIPGSSGGLQVGFGKQGKVFSRILTAGTFSDWYDSSENQNINTNRLSVGSNTVSADNSAAVGVNNAVLQSSGFATGYNNTIQAGAYYSHVEGKDNIVTGEAGHAEGLKTRANGIASHAEGYGTIASNTAQFVRGQYNKEDTAGLYAEIVGGGSSDNSRSNLYTLGKDGTIETRGNLKLAKELFNVSTDAYTINSKQTYIWSDGYFNQNNAWVVADGAKLWCCSQVLPINSNKIALTRTAIVHHAYFQMFGFNPFTAEDNTVSLANYGVAISGTPNIGDRVVIGKRKPNRTATGVPVTDYVFYAESDNQNLNITFVDTGTLTENYYQFVYSTVNNVTGWYDEYSHLYFIGDYYSDTTASSHIDRQHFNISNDVKYIRIFAVYQDAVDGATVALRNLAQVQEVSSVFKIDSGSDNRKNVGAMITFIDDDTSSKTLVKQYHDLFDSSHYNDVPTGYHLAGCYAVEAYRLVENPTLTRMTLQASSSTSTLGEIEDTYTPPYNSEEAGSVLLDLLKDYEEQGFEMIFHCMYQSGRATNAHNTAYIIDGYQRNTDNLNLVRHNIITGIRTIEGLGLANWRKHWVTPYGADDKEIQSIARSLGFESLIRTENGLISRDVYTDRYSIPRWGYDYGYTDGRGTPEYLKTVIDRAIATNSWIIIMSHVNAWGNDVEQYTNGFYDIVQHCIDSGIEIVSYSDGFERYKETLLEYEKLT